MKSKQKTNRTLQQEVSRRLVVLLNTAKAKWMIEKVYERTDGSERRNLELIDKHHKKELHYSDNEGFFQNARESGRAGKYQDREEEHTKQFMRSITEKTQAYIDATNPDGLYILAPQHLSGEIDIDAQMPTTYVPGNLIHHKKSKLSQRLAEVSPA